MCAPPRVRCSRALNITSPRRASPPRRTNSFVSESIWANHKLLAWFPKSFGFGFLVLSALCSFLCCFQYYFSVAIEERPVLGGGHTQLPLSCYTTLLVLLTTQLRPHCPERNSAQEAPKHRKKKEAQRSVMLAVCCWLAGWCSWCSNCQSKVLYHKSKNTSKNPGCVS